MIVADVTGANALGLSAAFAAGFVSFVSPCVWPLVPAYLSYVSGVAFADLANQTRRVVVSTAFFVLGFGTVFTLVGVGVGVAGGFFVEHRRTLEVVSGAVIVLMGAAMLGVAGTGFLQRERRLAVASRPAGLAGAALAGAAFAIGWTPCIGFTLSAIIGVAAASGGALDGAALLAAYSLGLGLPFLLAGLFFTRLASSGTWVRRHTPALMRVAGALLVIAGVMVATGEMTALTRELSTLGTLF